MAEKVKIEKFSKSSNSFESFFQSPIWIFKTLAFDIIPKPKTKIWKWISTLILIYELVAHLFITYYVFRTSILTPENSQILLYGIFTFEITIKLLIAILNLKRLRKIFKLFDEIFPKNNEEWKEYSIEDFRLPQRIKFFNLLYILSSWLVSLCHIGAMAYGLNQPNKEKFHFYHMKPIATEYNFKYQTAGVFSVVFLAETFHVHFQVAIHVGLDLFLICFLSQICMHLSFIKRKLEQYEPNDTNEESDHMFLKKLVIYHQKVFDLHDKINDIYGMSLVISLITTMLGMCFLAVFVVIEGLGLVPLAFCGIFVGYITKFYYVCTYAEEAMNVSEEISLGAYNSAWYNGSTKYKSDLLLIMIRSQRAMKLSAHGFQPITLESFKNVISMAYQVFALLQTLLRD